MISIKTKYVILFWIIILVLFTFYCIIKMKYLREKYVNTSFPTPNPTNTENIIDYINNIQKQKKITDLDNPLECKNLYDDNIRVQSMGYNNCESAYSDYLEKGFDVNNSYGQSKSLAEICPISTQSTIYSQCLTSLLNKFTNNINMVNSINTDMSTSINKRLQDRSTILDNIQNQMNPLIINNDQTKFNNYMKVNNSIATYKDDVLGLSKKYYQNRYGNIAGFSNIEAFDNIDNVKVNIIDPAIKNLFFGDYKPINGQYLVFNDLILTLGHDVDENADLMLNSEKNSTETQTQRQNTQKKVILMISSKSNGLDIVYNIINIDNFKALPNSVKLSISSKKIINNANNSSDAQTIQQLLNTLGIYAPTQLVLSYEEYTSTEKILHKTYKLVNDNLDTILILNKF